MPARDLAQRRKASSSAPAPRPGKLAVLFPGQGAQYRRHDPRPGLSLSRRRCRRAGRGRPRLRATARRRSLERSASIRRRVSRRRSAAAQTKPPCAPPTWPSRPWARSSLGAWRVLEPFGVRADAFAGHSYGELAALCAAGRLGADDFHALSRLRGRLMAEAGTAATRAPCWPCTAPPETIAQVLREEKLDLVLANKNAPQQTVLSGPAAEIDRAAAAFAARQVGRTRLGRGGGVPQPAGRRVRRAVPRRAGSKSSFDPARVPVYANTTAAALSGRRRRQPATCWPANWPGRWSSSPRSSTCTAPACAPSSKSGPARG